MMASYLDHAAIPVRDIAWHIHFFRDVLGMPVRLVEGDEANPKQIWFWGGVQLKSDPDFSGPEGRLAHLGIMTEDLDRTLEDVYGFDVTELPQGRNWVRLPDGLVIEFIQAKGDAVRDILNVNPW